ncbi:response regulator transcription factor [Aeoliella mucimassa]|uniref:Photosynthetic apparatus regulatory protein RegA n=1 Tax=Aeoliella mucimassa TaxID=2527972 RepID=A0A518AGZ6_9BACT|nr:response regulator [Aeoliella mucimassa]QDU53997.1 Photosynthetic apparatus regulatory protein RegA [Aeoliella mucimassa]
MEQLLLVDDDELLRERMGRALAAREFEVVEASTYEEAVDRLESLRPQRAVLDLRMPGGSGLTLLKLVREKSPETRVVMLTGYGSIANAVDAMREGAVGYVTKPADADQVLAAFDAMPALHAETTDEFHPPSLAEAEWNHIQQVLSDCDGNLSRAATLLDIPRRTLQRKLKKLAP